MRAPVVALALALVAGCNWTFHRMQKQQGCRIGQETQLLPGGTCNLMPPQGIVQAGPAPTPPTLTRELVLRGQDRYDRFCGVCHGIDGDGQSTVARAMTLRRPPSLLTTDAQRMTDAHLLEVIQFGYGVMPSYGSSLPLRDRYAIVHYVRVLQRREVPLASLPPELKQEAMKWLR